MLGLRSRCSPLISMRLRSPGESPRDCAERLAREKALAVFQGLAEDCVLGADTIVVIDEMRFWASLATRTMLLACCECCRDARTP